LSNGARYDCQIRPYSYPSLHKEVTCRSFCVKYGITAIRDKSLELCKYFRPDNCMTFSKYRSPIGLTSPWQVSAILTANWERLHARCQWRGIIGTWPGWSVERCTPRPPRSTPTSSINHCYVATSEAACASIEANILRRRLIAK
jgi:hypothetical protein